MYKEPEVNKDLKNQDSNEGKSKEIKYGISDIKYDIKTGLIRIVKNTNTHDRSDNEVTITQTTTTTINNANDDSSSDNSDDEDDDEDTPLTRVETPKFSPRVLRNTPKHGKNTRQTPSVPPRSSRRLVTSPNTTSRLARRANELAYLSNESNAYLAYKENNKPTTRLEQALYSLGFGDEPLDRNDAMSRKDWSKWHDAEKTEVQALFDRGTFVYVPREKVPPGKKVIKCKWVYKRKPDRYKARVVARGFLQSPCMGCRRNPL